MISGENELAAAAQRFGALMMTAARSGGLTPESGPRALLAAVRGLAETTQALVEAEYPRPEEVRALIDQYADLHARVFAAMKTFSTPGGQRGVQ
jgi:hypothetical protein